MRGEGRPVRARVATGARSGGIRQQLRHGGIVDGSGTGDANNTVTIETFVCTGMSSVGCPPGTYSLTDVAFSNTTTLAFTAGGGLAFNVALSGNVDANLVPDAFQLSILDGNGNPLPTTDPSGSDAVLFAQFGQRNPILQGYGFSNGSAPPTIQLDRIQPLTVVWPLNGSAGTATTLTAQWSPVPGATQYQVYFGDNSSNLALYATVFVPAVTEAFYNLRSGTTYYWKVVALAGSSSASSAVWSFTTSGVSLSPPTVVWPLNGGTGAATTLTAQWSPVPGATQYQVYFGDNSSNLALYATVFAPAVTEAFYNLRSGTTYYWKVVALTGSSSASSAVWSFTTSGGSLKPAGIVK
jgi:hypothetical protein